MQPLAPELRRLPEEALGAAEAGIRRLPADGTFNNGESAAHYGLSWWACEYLVAGFGVDSLWQLLEELDEPQAETRTRCSESLIGLTGRKLARRGGQDDDQRVRPRTSSPRSRRRRLCRRRATGPTWPTHIVVP